MAYSNGGTGIDFDLEFQALKDTVWRLTCRVVSLESGISEIKEKLAIETPENESQLTPSDGRSFTNTNTSHSQLYSEVAGVEISAIDIKEELISEDAEEIPLTSSDLSSDQENELEELANDSNYTPCPHSSAPVTPTRTVNSVKRKRIGPWFGPDDDFREKNFECNVCYRRFTRNEHLQDHLGNHEGKTFTCTDCGATFRYKRTMKRHQKYKCNTKQTVEEPSTTN